MVEEDLNNGDILDFYMKCQRNQGIEPGEMAAEFLLFLTDAEDPEKKTARDLTADDKDIMQQGKDDGMIYMYQWEEGMLIFKESQKDSLTVRIIPRKLLLRQISIQFLSCSEKPKAVTGKSVCSGFSWKR